MTIILYDIPSTLKIIAWSPNTWKTRCASTVEQSLPCLFSGCRFCLNYKGIPYKTQWVDYPDIRDHCMKHGIAPTLKRGEEGPPFTLPAIHDTSTGAYVSDSFAIAEYLEKTFPDTPPLFPKNTVGLQAAFSTVPGNVLAPLFPLTIPCIFPHLSPKAQTYFRSTREPRFGKKIEDIAPKGEEKVKEWAKFRDGMTKIDSWYAKSGGPFLMGDVLSWADVHIGSLLIWCRLVWGENSQDWADVEGWDGGRWKRLSEIFKEYETVN